MYSSIIFLQPPLFQHTQSIGLQESVYPQEKCLWLSDKPCKHHFFHSLVPGKLAVSKIISEWTIQVTVKRGQIKPLWRMLQYQFNSLLQSSVGRCITSSTVTSQLSRIMARLTQCFSLQWLWMDSRLLSIIDTYNHF